jgi:hypothetical protein
LKIEESAVLAPTTSASDRIASALTRGVARRDRQAARRLDVSADMSD